MKRRVLLFKNLLRNNRFRISFLKYFAGAACAALVAFAVYGIAAYNLYTFSLQEALSYYREQNLSKTGELIDYVLKSVEQDYYMIAANEDIVTLLTLPKAELPDLKQIPYGRLINNAVGDLFTKTLHLPAMDSIYVYGFDNECLVTWTEYRSMESFSDNSFLEGYEQGHSFYARKKRDSGDAPNVITLVREIMKDEKRIGVVAFNFKYDRFGEYVSQSFENQPETIYVQDRDGHIFYTTEAELLNTNVNDYEPLGEIQLSTLRNGSDTTFSEGLVFSSFMAAGGNYSIINGVKNITLLQFQRSFVSFTIWGSLIGLAAAFVIAFFAAYRLYRNVINLMVYVSAPYEGDSARAKDVRREMAYIAENIAGFVDGSHSIEHELADKLLELKRAQAIALQNQINPHFILNTLQMVNLDILREAQRDTVGTKVISLLSDILQSNLNTTDHIVPLSYEIRQAMKYVEIENIRNKGKFSVEWDIEEDLMEYRTVKFVIQPILENSLKHGLSSSRITNKKITVRAYKENRALVIEIKDNGLGIAPKVLTDLQSRLKRNDIQEDRHIGLCNVAKRIQLVFGESYGVSISSAPGEGTTVTLRQNLVGDDWN
jgi:Putative regulator of cell autolysis